MHRTQLLLEEWQHAALKARADREGRSISQLVREILADALRPREAAAGGLLREARGSGNDPTEAAEDHDEFLYRATDPGPSAGRAG